MFFMDQADIADIRLWAIEKVANVLVDLMDGSETEDEAAYEEAKQSFMYAGDMILDALNFQVVSSDGSVATVTIGEPVPPSDD